MLCGGPVTLTHGYYRNRLSYQSRNFICIVYGEWAANVYKTKVKIQKLYMRFGQMSDTIKKSSKKY